MRNLKRVLSTVMAVAMMMSLVVFSTSAAFNDQDKIENTDAVNMNVALNIINGRDDGSFDPTGDVTRAEMVKMICVLLNGGNEPAVGAKTGTATFTDIRGHWAEGYIEYCVASGIVAGMGDGTFAPNGKVTGTQAAKMLLVALGYDAAFEGFNGASWSVKINVAASQKKLYDDISMASVNTPLTRDSAAQMVWNALQAEKVKYSYSLTTGENGSLQNVQVREDIKNLTLLVDRYKTAEDAEGLMTGYTWINSEKKFSYEIEGYSDFKTAQDFTHLFGMTTVVVYKDSKTIYGMYAKDAKVLATGILGDLEIDGTAGIKFDGIKYKLDNTLAKTDVLADNGEGAANYNLADAAFMDDSDVELAFAPYTARLIDDDNNGKVDRIVYLPFTVEKVTYVDSKEVTTEADEYAFEDYDIYSDAKKNDWAMVVTTGPAAVKVDGTLTKVTPVTGKITSVKSEGEIVINGVTYTNSVDFNSVNDYKIGNDVELIAVNGYIFHAKKTAGTVSSDKLALVILADLPGEDDTTDEGKQQAQLLFADGTKKVVKVAKIDGEDVDASDNHFAAGKVELKTIWSYAVNKDGNYELEDVKDNYDALYVTAANATLKSGKVDAKKDDAGSVKTVRFADDAVIFYLADGKYKATTGAAVNSWGEADVDAKSNLYTNESNGFNYAQTGFLSLEKAPSDKDTKYGYIVAAPELVKDGSDYYYQVKIWNGSENVTYKAESTGVSGASIPSSVGSMTGNDHVQKGTPVSYKISGDGIIEYVTSLADKVDAVVAYTDGKSYVGFENAGELKITSDTAIIRFSSENKTGQAGDVITVAKSGNYNCFVVEGDDGELDAVIIDKDSNLNTAAAEPTSVVLDVGSENEATVDEGDLLAGDGEVSGFEANKDTVKITVTGSDTYTVTINNKAYTNGADYVIPEVGTYTVKVKVSGEYMVTTTYTYKFIVAE